MLNINTGLKERMEAVYRRLKPCTDVASNLLVIDLRLDVQIPCDDLQQMFEHAEYFTCDPLISQPILIQFSHSLHH